MYDAVEHDTNWCAMHEFLRENLVKGYVKHLHSLLHHLLYTRKSQVGYSRLVEIISLAWAPISTYCRLNSYLTRDSHLQSVHRFSHCVPSNHPLPYCCCLSLHLYSMSSALFCYVFILNVPPTLPSFLILSTHIHSVHLFSSLSSVPLLYTPPPCFFSNPSTIFSCPLRLNRAPHYHPPASIRASLSAPSLS